MFDDIDFDRAGIQSVEYDPKLSEDLIRALKIIRARLQRLARTPSMDPRPTLTRIIQMIVQLKIQSTDEPIGANDTTYVSTPLPPLTQEEIAALIADATTDDKIYPPIW